MNWNREFDLLSEYMRIYIQLLPECVQCGGKRINKPQLPTFEYFKQTYSDDRYSLVIPGYKEAKTISDNHVIPVHTHGLGSKNGIAYRHYNFWMGCKFFTGGISGNYTIETKTLNTILIKK